MEHMENKTNSSNLSSVISVRGSIVDIRFEKYLPPIYSLLRAGDSGRIAIEVLTQLDSHRVRGIALTPTEGLSRGTAVEGYERAIEGARRQGNSFPHV